MVLLLQNGANPNNRQPIMNWAPIELVLHSSIYKGLYERKKLFVENGAGLTTLGNYGYNITWSSLTRNDHVLNDENLQEAKAEVLRTLKYLVEHGAGVEIMNRNENYLTYLVVDKNYIVLKFLFKECGIDVNEPDVLEETALIRASKLGNLQMVDFLLGFGADTSLKDREGKTAIDYAREGNFTDIVERLETL